MLREYEVAATQYPRRTYGGRRAARRNRIIARLSVLGLSALVLFAVGFLLGSLKTPAVDDGLDGLLGDMQSPPYSPIPAATDEGGDMPLQSVGGTPWYLMLVNAQNPLPEGYAPEVREVGWGASFDARAADELSRMLEDANAQGLSPIICSGYRTVEYQQGLFNNKVQREMNKGQDYDQAVEAAKTTVAFPGTSEHHLGLAVDIVALSNQNLDDAQANTPENKWLRENCHRYGFILRYPSDKSDITGIIFEPWHFRYVGVEAATAIMEAGICLEEYLSGQ